MKKFAQLSIRPRGLAMLALLLLLSGCTARAAERREVMADDPLLDSAELDEARGLWWSAPLTRAEWVPIGPSGRVIMTHGLGRDPVSVQVYLSFTADDREDDAPRQFMLAAGNKAQVVRVTADEVEILNNSAGSFYMRLLLQ